MDTLIVFVVLLAAASILSLVSTGIASVMARIRHRSEREDRALYDARFARLAQEANAGPLLITDQRP